MNHSSLKPFQDETTSLQAYDVTVENRLDKVIIYGDVEYWTSDDHSTEITKDQAGLNRIEFIQALLASKMRSMEPATPKAVFLKDILDNILACLKAEKNLPATIVVEKPVFKDNPFA